MSNNQLDYFQYLSTRTRRGLFFREKILYPKIVKRCKGRVLDFGCGIGDMLRFLEGSSGVDINEHCVQFCRSQNLDAFVLGREGQIPFADNSFDTVLMDNVLEHIEDPEPVIKEIIRVLKVDGRLLIGVPGVLGYTKDPDHKVFYDQERMSWLACSVMGLHLEEWFYSPFWFPWATRIFSRFCVFGSFRLVTKGNNSRTTE